MVFLDSSAIIDYMSDDTAVVEYLDGREPFFTSAVCVYEVLDGLLGAGKTDVVEARRGFGGVQTLDFTEQIALEAARLQDEMMNDGIRLSTGDALIAATARSTGDELVVTDADFETEHLQDVLTVTNLRRE
ncbi:PIN domain-containing protein [Halorientalis brevis]|uniref:Ribonuclease VapC n=1 Tax=Halorientalis brevis TaxID=1126241 RepID=A0ABD6C9B8_9EURY|nr:PIN domain-containing protein [Halorientalis brevis]